ncbi:cation channel sperm-associated auxiliary subunit zeta isoform X2 [Sorex araneus]|uniref:cation channel sperm-associated auxiliary subunit zeta isoform X2 n=1 Tax=Sorex araneus TaxID=42254 RepID=UPI0003314B96|nr:cation channel sperm-associated auxiliary subunit zeta isoform X2 [Sorex araneus]
MSSGQDIRDLWTKATLSQVDGSVSLNIVYEDIESQSSYSSSRSEALWSRSKESLMHIWKRPDSEEDNVSLKKSDTFLDKLSVGRLSDRDMPTYRKISSSLLTGVHKYAPHKPYWMEQHTRLPLPLVELMENEVLEILTKALKSYQSAIGDDHVLTMQLQRQVEALRKRRYKRLNVVAQENEL